MSPSFPTPIGPILQHTFHVELDHAYDLVTRRSLTVVLGCVGSAPSTWMSERQGSTASSTYAAEFLTLRTATEDSKSLGRMLRCLGCTVSSDGICPTRIFGNNSN